MNTNIFRTCVFISLTFGSVNIVNAALLTRLGGLAVYDTEQNITWIADANLAESNTFGVADISATGAMSWASGKPNEWLTAMNNANYLGFDNWRLPTTTHPDATCSSNLSGISVGSGCTGSELGHLFYIGLDGVAGEAIALDLGQGADAGPFSNMTVSQYWSETSSPFERQYAFGFGSGHQVHQILTSEIFVLALRNGDVGVVPLPAAIWLFGSGFISLIGFSFLKKPKNRHY